MGVRATMAGLETQPLDKIRKGQEHQSRTLEAVLAELKAIHFYLAEVDMRDRPDRPGPA